MFLKTHLPLTERLFTVSVFPVMAVNVTLNTTVTLHPYKSCLIAINICLKGGLIMSTPNFILTRGLQQLAPSVKRIIDIT